MRIATQKKDEHEAALIDDAEYRRRWLKFNAYACDYAEMVEARSFLPSSFPEDVQTLEASIMDAADDLTYAVHDLEDFFVGRMLDMKSVDEELEKVGREGVLSHSPIFEKLGNRLARDYVGYYDQQQLIESCREVKSKLNRGFPSSGTPDQYAAARQSASRLIGDYISEVSVKAEQHWPKGPYVALRPEAWHEVQILKEITKRFIIERPDVAVMQRGQQRQLRRLIELLQDWKTSTNDFKRLPATLRSEIEIARGQSDGKIPSGHRRPSRPARGPEDRCILDYLCSLTDEQCSQMYHLLMGAMLPTLTRTFF